MTDSIVVIIAVVVIFVILISQAWRRRPAPLDVRPSPERMDQAVNTMLVEFSNSPIIDLIESLNLIEQKFIVLIRTRQFIMPNGAIDWYTMLGVLKTQNRMEMLHTIDIYEQAMIISILAADDEVLRKWGLSRAGFISAVTALCDFMKSSFSSDFEFLSYNEYLGDEKNKSYRFSDEYVEIMRKYCVPKQRKS